VQVTRACGEVWMLPFGQSDEARSWLLGGPLARRKKFREVREQRRRANLRIERPNMVP
jgi:hypothetical protein